MTRPFESAQDREGRRALSKLARERMQHKVVWRLDRLLFVRRGSVIATLYNRNPPATADELRRIIDRWVATADLPHDAVPGGTT